MKPEKLKLVLRILPVIPPFLNVMVLITGGIVGYIFLKHDEHEANVALTKALTIQSDENRRLIRELVEESQAKAELADIEKSIKGFENSLKELRTDLEIAQKRVLVSRDTMGLCGDIIPALETKCDDTVWTPSRRYLKIPLTLTNRGRYPIKVEPADIHVFAKEEGHARRELKRDEDYYIEGTGAHGLLLPGVPMVGTVMLTLRDTVTLPAALDYDSRWRLTTDSRITNLVSNLLADILTKEQIELLTKFTLDYSIHSSELSNK